MSSLPESQSTRVAAAVLIALLVGILVATPSLAAVTGATSTTTTSALAGQTVPLAGLSVSADGATESVSVILSTDVGSLTVDVSGTSATIDFGYTASGSEVAFTGTRDDVNAVLGTATLTTLNSDKGSDAVIDILARNPAGTVYSPENEHFYEFVPAAGISWTAARADAQTRSYAGQQGYLATVPNAEVNDVITSKIQNATNVWLGGQALDSHEGYSRVWEWVDGPIAGEDFTRCSNNALSTTCAFTDMTGLYENWAPGEPNNFSPGEQYVVTNWEASSPGEWNDLPGSHSAIDGYVVEYGDMPIGATAYAGLETASATVAVVGPPDPVEDLAATAGQGQATVSWTAPTEDGGAAITDYDVTVAPVGGDTTDCTGTGTSCTVTGLTPGTEYTITVRAENAHGLSDPRTTTVTPGAAPGVPTGPLDQVLVGEYYSDQVTSTGYPAPTYAITSGSLPAGLALNATTGAITGTPTATGPWSFQVTATNAYGSAGATFSGTAGEVPTITTATVGPFTWGTPVDMNLAATGFPVPTWSQTDVPPGLTLETDGRLHGTPTAVGDHDLAVMATNTHGNDVEIYTVTVAADVPSAPTITDVSSGDGWLGFDVQAPDRTGGLAITGYEYTLDGGMTWVAAAMTDGEFVITGLDNGTEYTGQVRALNGAGAGVASEPSSGTPGVASADALASTGVDSSLAGVASLALLAGLGLIVASRRRRDALASS